MFKNFNPTLLIIFLQLLIIQDTKDVNYLNPASEAPHVEVRPVFLNCEVDDRQANSYSPTNRFEREELFKHNVLRNCNKKLALTVKMATEPNLDHSSSDEYIPIEHVFDDGANTKRVRLLNPYILRLRREVPLQAYKLRRLDTVVAVFVDPNKIPEYDKIRTERNTDLISDPETFDAPLGVNQDEDSDVTDLLLPITTQELVPEDTKNLCIANNNLTLLKRVNRHLHNVVIEDIADDRNLENIKENKYLREFNHGNLQNEMPHNNIYTNNAYTYSTKSNMFPGGQDKTNNFDRYFKLDSFQDYLKETKHKTNFKSLNYSNETISDDSQKLTESLKSKIESKNYMDTIEAEYDLYEIGDPELWNTINVQLFEKLSSSDGKTLWNDITKGEQASVSTRSPEWTGQDMILRYRPSTIVNREDFSLPSTSLCLLVPQQVSNSNFEGYNVTNDNHEFIVVPVQDIENIFSEKQTDTKINIKKRSNSSDSMNATNNGQRFYRRVSVALTRALLSGNEDFFNVVSHGTDNYLTIPHRQLHRSHIDVEVRADENQLVRVGSSGRIATAVSDNTRVTRTIFTLQISNTGLVSARFRVATRECTPEFSGVLIDKMERPIVGPIVLAPRHTRHVRLELPYEVSTDTAQCSVALMNDNGDTVALRDVAIKKGDRCFCVWHCDCVCLSDDPKLICRDMSESQQSAAGLLAKERTRHYRSVGYPDVVPINIFVTVMGVLMTLLFLGFIKAFIGLCVRCVGLYGLDNLLHMPRKLDHYYETDLFPRTVVYDSEGYPIHPDTKKRTVQLVSRSMEFILNTIFFLTIPCIICDILKHLLIQCKSADKQTDVDTMVASQRAGKPLYSRDFPGSHRGRRRRMRGAANKWMSPHAQTVFGDFWEKGLDIRDSLSATMMPLLHEEYRRSKFDELQSSCMDSEQDDTEYVLTQMQKSRESLARSQRKP